MPLKLGLIVDDGTLDPDCLLAGISAAEREQYARRRTDRRRRRLLASRWLMRQHLAAELTDSPGNLEIVYPARRPPYCPNTPLWLGLSHSGPACLSLLSPHADAGCDIENARTRGFEPERLAQRHFALEEIRALKNTPAERRLGDFYRLWTLKEARLKALGLGLDAGLASPVFVLYPRLQCLYTRPSDPGFFGALELELPVGRLALAVAARQPPAGIVLERFEPAANGACRRTPVSHRWQTTDDKDGDGDGDGDGNQASLLG